MCALDTQLNQKEAIFALLIHVPEDLVKMRRGKFLVERVLGVKF
ncbi:MAG: hypothetical protein QXR19_13285 [Candidatus Jordarchaeaceae archaeon]